MYGDKKTNNRSSENILICKITCQRYTMWFLDLYLGVSAWKKKLNGLDEGLKTETFKVDK